MSSILLLMLLIHIRLHRASQSLTDPFPIWHARSICLITRYKDRGDYATGMYETCKSPINLQESIVNFTEDAIAQRLFGKNIGSDYYEKWYLNVVQREFRMIWILIRGTYRAMNVGQYAENDPDVFRVTFHLETAIGHIPTLRTFTIRKISIDSAASGWNDHLMRMEQQQVQMNNITKMTEQYIAGSISLHRRTEMLVNKYRQKYNSTLSKRRHFNVQRLKEDGP